MMFTSLVYSLVSSIVSLILLSALASLPVDCPCLSWLKASSCLSRALSDCSLAMSRFWLGTLITLIAAYVTAPTMTGYISTFSVAGALSGSGCAVAAGGICYWSSVREEGLMSRAVGAM